METIVDSKKIAEQYIDSNKGLLIDDLSKIIDASILIGLQQIKDGKTSSLEEVSRRLDEKYFS